MTRRPDLRIVSSTTDDSRAAADRPAEPAARASRAANPLDLVMEQVRAGTGDPLSISLLTGLDASVVRACLDHLVRTGRLRTEVLASACSGVCGGCPAVQLGCGSGEVPAQAAVGGRVRGLRVIGLAARR